MVVVQIATVFQSRPGVARILNDNYCNKDPLVQVDLSVLGQNRIYQVKVPRIVYLRPVLTHVPFVIGTGQLQRKARSLSDRNKTSRKCFFCLSFCLSKCPQCCRKSTSGV